MKDIWFLITNSFFCSPYFFIYILLLYLIYPTKYNPYGNICLISSTHIILFLPQITWKFFHFPDFCLHRKITALTIQSLTIASAIPITPMSNTMPRSQDKKSRTTIVEMIETYMVNFTSPAERSPLLKAPEKGYAVALKTLWISTSQITNGHICLSKASIHSCTGIVYRQSRIRIGSIHRFPTNTNSIITTEKPTENSSSCSRKSGMIISFIFWSVKSNVFCSISAFLSLSLCFVYLYYRSRLLSISNTLSS